MCICYKCDRKRYKPMGAFYLAFDDDENHIAEYFTFCQAGIWENGKIPEKKECKKMKEVKDFTYQTQWYRRNFKFGGKNVNK